MSVLGVYHDVELGEGRKEEGCRGEGLVMLEAFNAAGRAGNAFRAFCETAMSDCSGVTVSGRIAEIAGVMAYTDLSGFTASTSVLDFAAVRYEKRNGGVGIDGIPEEPLGD